jgi:hypothetical protein
MSKPNRRKKFGRYWKVGFIFVVGTSAVNSLLTAYMNFISSLPTQEWRYGSIFFRSPAQLEWTVITIIVAIAFLIFVPWMYGRVIELFYKEFIMGKKSSSHN